MNHKSPPSKTALLSLNTSGSNINSGMTQRLNLYLHYLQKLPQNITIISPKQMADEFLLPPKLVRQDMKTLLNKERVAEESRDALFHAIAKRIEIRKVKGVVLAGVGRLGSALMSYAGFSVFDLDILAGFDVNEKIIRKGAYGKPVYHIDKMDEVCKHLDAKIGIITTPGNQAQKVCSKMVHNGIKAIWNFTSIQLKSLSHVLIYDEDMSGSLQYLAEYVAQVETTEVFRNEKEQNTQ